MQTSLKTGFAQIFSCCPKKLSCQKFGGAAAPLAPPGPYAYDTICVGLCRIYPFCRIKSTGGTVPSMDCGGSDGTRESTTTTYHFRP